MINQGAMAYDALDLYLLRFGGGNTTGIQSQTWILNNGVWHQLFPTVHPSPRRGAVMAYDPVDHEIVPFGGWNPRVGNTNTIWVLSNGTWSSPASPRKLTVRQGSAMAYDPALNVSVLYAGIDYPAFSDTWT